jgi:hypothetical protein
MNQRLPRNLDYMMPKEGGMMQQQLTEIIQDATALRSALHPDDNVPAWTQFKVSTAQDRLHAASSYLTHKINLIQSDGVVRADLGALDAYLSDAMDLGGKEERNARRLKLKGKRYDRKNREKAKLRILLRVAYKAAKTNNKKPKRGFLGSGFRKALRAGDRSLDAGKSMRSALIASLVYAGLSKKDAEKNATFTMAAVESGSFKAGHAALKKKYGKKTSKNGTVTAATPGESYDPNEFVSADTEFTENTALPESDEDIELSEYEEGTDDLEGFGVASAEGSMFDRVKPYLPWAALAIGVGAVVYSSSNSKKA